MLCLDLRRDGRDLKCADAHCRGRGVARYGADCDGREMPCVVVSEKCCALM